MELLLHLVEKNQLDIYTVSIAAITDQFINYVENSGQIELENIGEFMVMASLLMRIKIKQLLPSRLLTAEDEEDLVNEEEALVERLIEYRMFKEVSSYLEERLEGRVARVYYRPADDIPGEISWEWTGRVEQLIKAFISLEKQSASDIPVWNLVPQHDIDIDQMMHWLLTKLTIRCEFTELWRSFASRRERAALFLALLELIHLGQVEAYQELAQGPIILRRIEVAVC